MSWIEVAPGTYRVRAPAPTRGQPSINVYVVSSREGVIVYDPGYGASRSSARVLSGVARLLLHLKRTETIDPRVPLREAVKIVVISHEHHDHASGAAAFKREYPGCLIAASRATARLLGREENRRAGRDIGWKRAKVMAWEFSSHVVLGLLGTPWTIQVDTILSDGDVVKCGDRQLHVIVAPGHSPGQVLLHDPRAGWLLSSDLVLQDISTWLGPPRSDYVAYKRSMTRVWELHPTAIFPAHGRTIDDPAGRLQELLRFRLLRERQIARACLVQRTGKTVAWMLYKDRGAMTVFIATGMIQLVMDKLARDGVLRKTTNGVKGARYVALMPWSLNAP